MSGIACAIFCHAAVADTFPSHPLTLISPFVAGSGSDLTARALAPALGEVLGQPVIVENRAGAGGALGSHAVAVARPDGYTMLLAGISFSMLPAIRKPNFDPVKDFESVILMGTQQLFFIVRPSMPVNSLAGLIAFAKKHPGKLNYGSGGIGSIGHLEFELLKKETDIDIVHIPFKGNNEAMAALMAGRIDTALIPAPVAMAQIQAGKIKPLSVQGNARMPELPNVPTTAEAGYPDAGDAGWYIILVPAHTPRDVVAKLNAAYRKALAMPSALRPLSNAGITPLSSTPAEADLYLKDQVAKWTKVVKDAHIHVEAQ
jgi:tripartite-type tricarboxylate transporter receptor subunit TctC